MILINHSSENDPIILFANHFRKLMRTYIERMRACQVLPRE